MLSASAPALHAQQTGGGRYDTPGDTTAAQLFGPARSQIDPASQEQAPSASEDEARQGFNGQAATPNNTPPSGVGSTVYPTAPPTTAPSTTSPQNTTPSRSPYSAPAQPLKARANDLVRSMLKRPSGDTLSGQPVTLTQILSSRLSRKTSTESIEAYWDLAAAVADYYLTLREKRDLDVLRASVSRPGPGWSAQADAMASRLTAARLSAIAAQQRLASLIGDNDPSVSPSALLPEDAPHTGSYDTRFDEIFTPASAPDQARALAGLLPQRYARLQADARSVREAQEWLGFVSRARSQDTDGLGLLKAHQLLVLQRRAFLASVHDYNVEIARYAELAAPGTVGAERLVAMLIRDPAAPTGLAGAGGDRVQRASAEAPLGQTPSKTFAAENGWSGSGATAQQSAPGQERSILRRPEIDSAK
ncbi:MAG: hypothetical protein AAGA92_08785 [Planctomycetota bacterium]